MNHGWEKKRWKQVLTIINGKNQKAVETLDGMYPIYGSGGIMGYASEYLCPEDCTIIGRKGSINKPIFVKTKFWNVDTAFGISVNHQFLVPKYLYYFCVNYDFMRHNKATTLPSLVKTDLLEISMSVPPMTTQEQIISELDKINELIEVKRSQLADLDSLAQSIFYEMFGDPIENPKGWKWNEISKVANIKIGPFGSLLHKEDYICGGTPLINPIHMQNGYVKADENFTISDNKKIELTSYLLSTNDIIFGRRGDIGRCALITSAEDGFLCGTGSLFLRFFIEINPIYSLWVLKSPSITHFLLEKAKGATMLNINCGIIASVPLILPPIELQNQFAAKIKMIEEQKKHIDSSLTDLQTLLASRMDYWFND